MACRVRTAPVITRSPVRTTFSPLRFEPNDASTPELADLMEQLNQNFDRVRAALENIGAGVFNNYAMLPYVDGEQVVPGTRAPASTAVLTESFGSTEMLGDASGTEVVLYQFPIDGSLFPGTSLRASFRGLMSATTGPAVVRVRVGGAFVNIGDPSGGDLVAAVVVPVGGLAAKRLDGTFDNPAGVSADIVPLQITIQSSGSGNDAAIQGIKGLVSLAA